MVHNRYYIISLLLFFFLTSCSNKIENFISHHYKKLIKEQNIAYKESYQQKNLLDHFPGNITDTSSTILASPPACPPEYECLSQFGIVYLVHSLDTSLNMIPEEILYRTYYSNEKNIIINLLELQKDIFSVEKCNVFFPNKYPVPYFERFNFRLGRDSLEQIVNGELKKRYIYEVPADLEVIVIEAEAGNFWIERCNESRPESLKDWKNGYSKGIALSKQESLIAYWLIVW